MSFVREAEIARGAVGDRRPVRQPAYKIGLPDERPGEGDEVRVALTEYALHRLPCPQPADQHHRRVDLTAERARPGEEICLRLRRLAEAVEQEIAESPARADCDVPRGRVRRPAHHVAGD